MRRNLIAATLAAAALVALAGPGAALAHDGPPAPGWDASAEAQLPGPPVDGTPDVDVGGMPAGGAAVGLQTFEEPLRAYGEWTSVPQYGQVWRPAGVAAGWRPYYYGKWEWTNEGWLWVTDEPFGWATYHYGRWAWDVGLGWIWVPGYQWAPAWVTWRYGPDTVGWAPLAPGFSVYVSSYPVYYSWWTFMPCGFFVGSPVWRHAYPPAAVPGYWGGTRPAPPRSAVYGHPGPAWGGPARPFLESRIGRPIAPVRVQGVSSPAQIHGWRGGGVPVYRPEVHPGPAVPPAAGRLPAQPTPPGYRPQPRPNPTGPVNPYQPGQGVRTTPAQPTPGGYRGSPTVPAPPAAAPMAPRGSVPAMPVSPGVHGGAPSGGHGGGAPAAAPVPSGGHSGGSAPAPAHQGGSSGSSGGGHGGGHQSGRR